MKLRLLLCCAVFLALLAGVDRALASMVHFDDQPLTEVLARSNLIFIGTKVKPDALPKFKRNDEAFTITEVLRGDATLKGKTQLVRPANWQLNDAMAEHYAKHGNQGMPSPIVHRYVSSISREKYEKTKKVIAFLICSDGVCRFTFEEAYESPAKRDEIMKAIAANPLKP